MEDRIKLIWDFRGPDAAKTAEHHLIHLKEFAGHRNMKDPVAGTDPVSEMHSLAFLVVKRSEMIPVRDALKPHRATLYVESPSG